MPDDPRSDRDLLVGQHWEIPVTDEFVTGVLRGVRRRRAWRRAAGGGALMMLAGVVAVVIGLAGGAAPGPPVGMTPAPVTPSDPPLDGFRIDRLPAGVHAVRPDSWRTCAMSAVPYDCPDPRPGDPTAGNAARRFDRGVGVYLWVLVLRPETTTPAADRAQITAWLNEWATADRTPIETFDAPAGRAQVLASIGSEVTVYSVAITTGDGVVISISGAAGLTVADLKDVAMGIRAAS